MKLQGVFGKGSGKVGASVWAVSGGEQIVREYNKEVSNPNTDAQVAQRAKLKLMSQLGAALAPALGFAKKGLVSARNQFVSHNIGISSFEGDFASVPVTKLQLTPSNVEIAVLAQPTYAGGVLGIEMAADVTGVAKRVVYVICKQTTENQLVYVMSKVVSEAGANGTFPTTISDLSGDVIVYAYGVKDLNSAATMRYDNYESQSGDDLADLEVIKLFRTADYGLTKTVGIIVTEG